MNGIDRDAAVELLQLIVSTPSVNPAFFRDGDDLAHFGEERLARALADWIERQGLQAELDFAEPGRPNLIVRVKGSSGGPRMLWEGHLDTVQVTGMTAPFSPRIEGGRLYGRGAVDDGGCVAAFLLAMRAIAADPPPGDVDFVAAMAEEFNYRGVLHHIARGEPYALGVAGEPTDLAVVRACKGTVRWFVDLRGRPAHTAKPHEGLSAVTAGRALLDAYDEEMTARTAVHPLLGPPTLTCTAFEAGEGPNTVPSRARLRFDYRYLPTESGAAVYGRFKAIAEGLAARFAGLSVTVEPPFIDSSAMDVPEDSAIVREMSAVRAERGLTGLVLGVPYGSDATKMVNDAAIPTIVFGPGSIDQAHSLDEYVEIDQVVAAAQMLVALARRLR
ncbi:MAG: M20/M25/M40 family metallo-hydrolase [Rhizobiales bacterium]|nr:M20/M25/M40 family metallo-hydrolase [Hyphomicrobiales bacterium]